MRRLGSRRHRAATFMAGWVLEANAYLIGILCGLLVCGWIVSGQAAPVVGTKKVVVLHVYFKDYDAESRFSRSQIQGFYAELDQLWRDTSYDNIDITAEVSSLFQLTDNRSAYIDDFDTGDLSNGGKFIKVLTDAIANSPSSLNWDDTDAVHVLMAETDASEFHRGQATTCNLPMGPGGDIKNVGCAIFSENPSETELQAWGRWAHEMGHTFQESGPAHPSNYRSEFELMDSNYPGQTGAFEKQDHVAFPGWLPESKYQVITPDTGGASAAIWALEYDPSGRPNVQAAKVVITSSFYYLVSVRRQLLGDDLNGDFAPPGIPDEGVLIERVNEGSDPWVRVIGRGGANGDCDAPDCNRNALWQEGDHYDGGSDGVFIDIAKQQGADDYIVRISYDKQVSQPDVMLNPWTSPPGNTWETTDIWVDSPVNDYGIFRYGMWDDGSGNMVPRGNGDDPAIGQVNRLYARVRNVGFQAATDVVVTWEITDPPGLGIAGANGWVPIGSVDKTRFPDLANIPAGGFVDVYIEWTPDFEVSEADMAAGRFAFHTCVRVKLNAVAGETVLGNQDGEREQENIDYFQATDPGAGGPAYATIIRLRNDDVANKKFFYLNYESELPKDWKVELNEGKHGLELGPGEVIELPVKIVPGSNPGIGNVFGVDVAASSMRLLVNELNPKDVHPEFKPLGGVRVEARVLIPMAIRCEAQFNRNKSVVMVTGDFLKTANIRDIVDQYVDARNPWRVMIQGVNSQNDFLTNTTMVVSVQPDTSFRTELKATKEMVGVVCLFAGTTELASAGSGYVRIR